MPSRETSFSLAALTRAMHEQSSRLADGYAGRLDNHLATLPDDAERLAMIRREKANWINRYEAFCVAVDSGRLKIRPDGPTSFDYMATLAVIGEREARYATTVVQ